MGEAGARRGRGEVLRSPGLPGGGPERERGGAGSEGHVASPAQPWAAENQPTNQPTGRPSERSVFQALNMFVMTSKI